MLDLFSIFSKGGIVLWCFQSTSEIFSPSVNALIRSVILQERSGNNTFSHNALSLQYKLDNEFELVFVVAYQRILQLSYVDKFLNDVHLEFRDKYKNELQGGHHIMDFDFKTSFEKVLRDCEKWAKSQAKIPKQMRTFEDSQKSKKTVASMIERRGEDKGKKSVKIVESKNLTNGKVEESPDQEDDVIAMNRAKMAQKLASKGKKELPKKSPKSPKVERVKQPRVWELGGGTRDLPSLDFSTDKPEDADNQITPDTQLVGQMAGAIRDLEVESDESSSEEEEERPAQSAQKKSGGMFSIFKGLVGSKALTKESMRPVLDKLQDHLIGKNVAADIATKLCDSVATKLEGRVLGTFDSVAKTVKATLTESLVQILSPKRRVDILRDCMHAKQQGRPYVAAFCGTKHNGRKMVHLYEKGYGKDAAGIAMEAIRYATDSKIDVVLIDTAGRMQDNEPLMRALAKLIKVNEPDMVLFVGEALVGNEAVDQLVKFNQALADHSSSSNPHVIDGIVLTKFDTIDDKVGAAISMTYITGQPIVFVGTGQTYTDLKALNANAVVHALMK
ncbi:hypothetical protein SFRURICE_003541 [Spodoptera frugiperda]|nr:hypothetical protein SFRURICE_003541 [Spodoptera frugiperda]